MRDFWTWRTTVHTKKTRKYTKIIAEEITRPRREAEAAAKQERKAAKKAAREATRVATDTNSWWAEQRREQEVSAEAYWDEVRAREERDR